MTNQGKSRVISMRLKNEQMDRLLRIARRLGRTPSETAALLLDEALRRAEFAHIDFRDSPAGRQAYIQGSSLAVWEVVMVARSYDMDITRTSEHLGWPEFRARAALAYAAAYPEEIELALQDNLSYDYSTVQRLLPQTELFVAEERQPSRGSIPADNRKQRRSRGRAR